MATIMLQCQLMTTAHTLCPRTPSILPSYNLCQLTRAHLGMVSAVMLALHRRRLSGGPHLLQLAGAVLAGHGGVHEGGQLPGGGVEVQALRRRGRGGSGRHRRTAGVQQQARGGGAVGAGRRRRLAGADTRERRLRRRQRGRHSSKQAVAARMSFT